MFESDYRSETMNVTFTPELGNRPKLNGKHPLFLRITINRKIKRISLGFEISPNEWNPKKKEVRSGHPYAKRINQAILEAILEAKEKQKETKAISVNAIKEALSKETSEAFFPFADNYASKRGYNTCRGLRSEIKKFKDFVQNDQLTFREITQDLIGKYKNYLEKVVENNPNTIGKALTKLRTIIRQAVKNGNLPFEKNPFLHISIKHGKSDKVRLTADEVETFHSLNLAPGTGLFHTRNYWLFSFYTAGKRFGDIAQIRWEDLNNGYWFCGKEEKTKKSSVTKLNKQALAIIEQYKPETETPTGYIFPILNTNRELSSEAGLKKEISRKNALANKYLKEISVLLGLRKPISCHCSRHTFADLARKKTNDIYSISRLLNHSKISVTEGYLKELDIDSLDKAMDEIFG